MPEHTLPDALHPQQEDAADELQLRGGLKGRFLRISACCKALWMPCRIILCTLPPLMYRIWQRRCWKR